MSSSVPLTARQTAKAYTLEAGVPLEIDIPVDAARDWLALLKNTGANAVTSGTVARSPDGVTFEDAVAIPPSELPAAGATVPIEAERAPIVTLRLVLTSTLGTTVTATIGGR